MLLHMSLLVVEPCALTLMPFGLPLNVTLQPHSWLGAFGSSYVGCKRYRKSILVIWRTRLGCTPVTLCNSCLQSDMQLEPILRFSPSSNRAATVIVFEHFSLKIQPAAKSHHIKVWKKKMQSSCKVQHSWLRQDTFAASHSCFANNMQY